MKRISPSTLVRLAMPAQIARLMLATLLAAGIAFGADARLLSLIPAKTEAVVGINVRAILESGIATELMKPAENGQADGLAELSAMTGLDLKRDIDEAIFAGYNAPAGAGTSKPGSNLGVGFIKGTFDVSRIGSAILSKGGSRQSYKGYTLYRQPAGADKTAARADDDVLAFLDSGTMVVGSVADVKQVLDHAQGQLRGEILSRVRDVGSRYDIWLVGAGSTAKMASSFSGSAAGKDNPAGALAGDFFKKVESTQGGIKLGPMINIGIEVNSTSPEDATALMNVLGFLKSMVSAQPAKEGQPGPPAGLVNMLNAVRMRTEAKTLFLTMDVPEADVVNFLRTARQQAAKPKEASNEEIIVIQ
ncbi:MAG: hypothetical protein LC114_00345 [Bryobacterales bacterium]|nr:hypothetical protein [Bryobacterales bacterium]